MTDMWKRRSPVARGFPSALMLLLSLAIAHDARAQQSGRTVADGVYTDVQATRGAAAYEGACGRCHRQDLSGGDGPALKDERFNKNFAGRDLEALYTKVATSMPRGAPGSMADTVYLDIIAHMLRENGFPSGPAELNAGALAGVEVLPTRPKPLPPVGDFSYVEVVGCLTPGSDGTWTLARAGDPVAVAPGDMGRGEGQGLGTHAFRLLDAMAYDPDAHAGHKMYVRGLLIKLPSEQRMTISDMKSIAATCAN